MRPTYSSDADAYRQKVQAFLAEKLPPDWGGIGTLEKGCNVSVFSADITSGYAEMRVTCN